MFTFERSASLSLAFAFGAILSGCGQAADASSQDLATLGSASEAATEQNTSLGNLVFASVSSQDPATASSDVAAQAKLWPEGCATRAKDPTNPLVVHITLNECTGPRGLVHLNGEETVIFSAGTNGGLHAELSSQNLTANGKPITHSASADITVMGNLRDVTWQGAWSRVNEGGLTVSHTSKLTIVVDTSAECRTTNGTAVTLVGGREVDSTITDYRICRAASGADECPSGTIVHTNTVNGKQITVEFDGSDQASVTAPKVSFEVPLVCGG